MTVLTARLALLTGSCDWELRQLLWAAFVLFCAVLCCTAVRALGLANHTSGRTGAIGLCVYTRVWGGGAGGFL